MAVTEVNAGVTAYLEITWKNRSGTETDPGNSTISIWDEDGVAKVEDAAMTKEGGTTSTYYYKYNTPENAVPAGKKSVTYSVLFEATVESDYGKEKFYFQITAIPS